jgi:hypothetical protein
MEGENCGIGRCTRTAAGYVDPGRRGARLEVYVGRRSRPDQVPLCVSHLDQLAGNSRMSRRALLALQTSSS